MSTFRQSDAIPAQASAANRKGPVFAHFAVFGHPLELIEVEDTKRGERSFDHGVKRFAGMGKQLMVNNMNTCGGGDDGGNKPGDKKPGESKGGSEKPKPSDQQPKPRPPPATRPVTDKGFPGVS